MIADTLINNDTITFSGGYSSWAGSTTPRPTITMSREQYLKDIACQEVKDIYARKLAQEANAETREVDKPNEGRTVKRTTDRKLPVEGETPDPVTEQYDKSGKLIRRRYYDGDGKVEKDIDYTDHNNPKKHPQVPHEHKWTWEKGKPSHN